MDKLTNSEARQLMKLHGHKFGYCKMCGPMIYCGYCGNNCCNACSGSFDPITHEEIPCPDGCKEAYAIQDAVKWPWYYIFRYRITEKYRKMSRSISNFVYHVRNNNG